MMYDYVTTKPELNDETLANYGIIEHSWLKDQAAKAHKYIERWKGKNGKWYYRYKSKASGLMTRIKRFNNNVSDPQTITYDGEYNIPNLETRRNWSGKPNSRIDGKTGSRLNAGIAAGRKRAMKKGVKIKGHTGNLTDRGYSKAEGAHITVKRKNGVREKHYQLEGGYEFAENPRLSSLKKKSRTRQAINAGRQRAKNKKPKNLSQKGYSSSRN